MPNYCTNCGNQLKSNAKFCDKCGEKFNDTNNSPNNNTKISCPKCGFLVPINNVNCTNCGSPLYQDSHTTAIVLGYLCSIFIPIFGIIFAIYLFTRNNKDVRKHGIIMIIIAVIMIIIAMIFLSYMSYVNSIHSYYYY